MYLGKLWPVCILALNLCNSEDAVILKLTSLLEISYCHVACDYTDFQLSQVVTT